MVLYNQIASAQIPHNTTTRISNDTEIQIFNNTAALILNNTAAQVSNNTAAQLLNNTAALISNNTTEIIHGTLEDNANFPWVVEVANCHGTLISESWVLTAAHCSLRPIAPEVKYNRTNPATGVLTSGTRGTDRVIIHPEYDPSTVDNDIALVHLTRPFDPDPLVVPANLPMASAFPNQLGVAASGIDHGSMQPVPPGKFVVSRVPVDHLNRDYKLFWLQTTQSSLCRGDSGSGYVVGGGGKYFVMGVTSGIEGIGTDICEGGTGVGVYNRMTNVFVFNQWIRSNTGLPAPSCCYENSDVLWRNVDGTLGIWFMNGATVIGTTNPSYYGHTVQNDWGIQGVARFFNELYHPNGDILWRDNIGNLALWKINEGVLTQDTYPTYQSSGSPTGNDWQVTGLGDFDGRGTSDILWRHASGQFAIWLIGNGQFIGEKMNPPNISTGWSKAFVGDFNGDRFSDMMLRHNEGGLMIWFNHCEQSCLGGAGGVSLDWYIVGTGDFNDDAYSDRLWRNTNGVVAVWIGRGDGFSFNAEFTNTHYPFTPGQDWQIQKIGDFNRDRHSDILWRNADGTLAIWFMYGGLILGMGYPGAAGNDWSVMGVGNFGMD